MGFYMSQNHFMAINGLTITEEAVLARGAEAAEALFNAPTDWWTEARENPSYVTDDEMLAAAALVDLTCYEDMPESDGDETPPYLIVQYDDDSCDGCDIYDVQESATANSGWDSE